VLCISHLGEMIREYAGDGSRFGVRLDYSFDGPVLRGTAGAIRNALPLLDDSFFVLYGDSYLPCDFQAVGQSFDQSGKLGLMTVFRNEGQWDTSNVEFTAGEILAYDKKARTPRMQFIDYGLGVFRRDAFAGLPADEICDLAQLYQDLLARGLDRVALDGKRVLVIIPDGPMHGLPFAALHNPDTRHYLVEDYVTAIAGSTKLYVVSLRRDAVLQAASQDPSVLLIGDPAFDQTSPFAHDLPRLRYAGYEVKQISRLYGSGSVLISGEEATKPRFFELAARSAVIHIAAHAIANQADPSYSMVLFAPSPGDSGLLNARELLTELKLDRTRLVVLAACSSAGGLPVGPEGVAPLVRPLIAAGVPAVIGSLWDVKDATAAPLLVSFHRRYGQGIDAAVALQSAQIELLRDNNHRDFQSPLVWGAFQVIGHGSSPFPASHRH